jgi:hypothetical protein
VLPAVDLDDDAQLLTQKIRDVRPDRCLPPETQSFEPVSAQVVPEPALRVGHATAQRFRVGCSGRSAKGKEMGGHA